jgi:hypothetical protein
VPPYGFIFPGPDFFLFLIFFHGLIALGSDNWSNLEINIRGNPVAEIDLPIGWTPGISLISDDSNITRIRFLLNIRLALG